MPLNNWNTSSTSAACIATKMIIIVMVHDRVVRWGFLFVFILFCSGGEVDSGGER